MIDGESASFQSNGQAVRRFIRGRGSRIENETVILYNDSEDEATVTTASPATFRRLIRLGYSPNPARGINEALTAARFLIPKRVISFRKRRKLSEAQLTALANARRSRRKGKTA
jgi:hypothetical protein